VIASFCYTGDRLSYGEPDVKGDSFPMTWHGDGHLYTSAGDPNWGESHSGLDVERLSGGPTEYRISKVNPMNDFVGFGGTGPKPTGMIAVDDILYLAFQNLLGTRVAPHSLRSQHGSDACIIYDAGSRGTQWTPALKTIAEPMFPGYFFGGPTFVQFGRNNAGARDEFVYAVSSDQWDNGSNLRLGRVPADRIPRREAWQWVGAFALDGQPAWTHLLSDAIPVLSLHRWISQPEMVYLPAIRRYLLLTWRLHRDFSSADGSDLVILDAPEPWGPFSLVHIEELWEGRAFNAYCPRLPLKWLDADGFGGWLQFSGSWGYGPDGLQLASYRSHVRPFRLVLR